MGDPTPTTPTCQFERAAADPVATRVDRPFTTWPGNRTFTSPLTLNPKNLPELANAVLQAEAAGHHVRAYGSKWSFSDAVAATTGTLPGAMIVTEQLKRDLTGQLGSILAPGVDPTNLCYVEAGIKASDLSRLLADRGQALDAGGGSGQSLAGMLSTSTHSGDSLVPPLDDYVRAIHMVGAGGVQHWIEPQTGISDRAKLQLSQPCLAPGNIHYDTQLFRAALVAAGSMGVIYSVVLQTVPQFALRQHRVATTWEALLRADPILSRVMDGSFIAGTTVQRAQPQFDLLDAPMPMGTPFAPNSFSQVVLNPYPFYANDASLNAIERLHLGEHLCFVTNRVKVPIPAMPDNPPSSDSIESMGAALGHAALDALGGGIDYPGNALRFHNFSNSVSAEPDPGKKAAALINFLAQHYAPGTISALIHFVLRKILPVQDRVDTNLSEVIGWGQEIRSFCVEAAFPVAGALAFVPQVLALVDEYAARRPRRYVGGYLALRFVGQKTNALLGMQRWSPTCCVEYLGLAGTDGIEEFVDELQRRAIAAGGVLHLGLQNNVMTAADLRAAYGAANVDTFRRARGILAQDATVATFDNSFTDRLDLSAIAGGFQTVFDGPCFIRRVGVTADGRVQLDLKAVDGAFDWTWFFGNSARTRETLDIALAAVSAGKQVEARMSSPVSPWSELDWFGMRS